MARDETGSEIVQFVCVLPLFLAVVFGIVQVTSAMFSVQAFSSELEQASIRIDTAGLAAASDKERFVKDQIIGEVTQLQPDALEVRNVTLQAQRGGSTWSETGGALQTRVVQSGVSFDVTYRAPTFLALPGWQDVELSRHVTFSIDDQKAVEVQVGS